MRIGKNSAAAMALFASTATEARFLQVDPVGYDDQVNLYAYVENDPVNSVDSSGRRIEYINKGSAAQAQAAYRYLNRSETFRHIVSTLENSPRTYKAITGLGSAEQYDSKTRTIRFNPQEALITKDGKTQSGAIGGGHEFSHAFDHETLGGKQYHLDTAIPSTASVSPNGDIIISQGTSVEEARAVRIENRIAGELGDVQRANYHDSKGAMTMVSPTAHTCISGKGICTE